MTAFISMSLGVRGIMTGDLKKLVGKEVAKYVTDGDLIGIGTGTTVNAALDEIGRRVVSEGLHIQVVPSSYQSGWRCEELGLNVLSPGFGSELTWGFDGTDEVDHERRLIKGGGGALLQEKIMASKCKRYVIIADETKLVARLGQKAAVPVEIVPEALSIAARELKELGAASAELRAGVSKLGPVITERGNLIVDAHFDEISDDLEKNINCIVGVVENGLFLDYASEVLIAGADGLRKFGS